MLKNIQDTIKSKDSNKKDDKKDDKNVSDSDDDDDDDDDDDGDSSSGSDSDDDDNDDDDDDADSGLDPEDMSLEELEKEEKKLNARAKAIRLARKQGKVPIELKRERLQRKERELEAQKEALVIKEFLLDSGVSSVAAKLLDDGVAKFKDGKLTNGKTVLKNIAGHLKALGGSTGGGRADNKQSGRNSGSGKSEPDEFDKAFNDFFGG